MDKTWQKAPIKIKVKNPGDTKNIDSHYLDEDITNTLDGNRLNEEMMDKLHFDNFTYKASSELIPSIDKPNQGSYQFSEKHD